jgi:branched-chain amino acid aminotransferase
MKARMHRYILHNDEIRPASDKVLSPGQVGLLSGWGVFSTIKVSDGVLFAFERHWARMSRDAALMRVPLPADSARVENDLLRLVERNGAQSSTMRVVVVRNRGGMWEGPDQTRPSDLIAFTADGHDWGEAVKLDYVRQARHAASMFAGTKILAWAMNVTWLETAQSQGFDEVILLNERDEVAECTSANIFAARGDQVWTPPIGSGCLPGITRELLLGEDIGDGKSSDTRGSGGRRRGLHHVDDAGTAAGGADRRAGRSESGPDTRVVAGGVRGLRKRVCHRAQPGTGFDPAGTAVG